MPFIIFYLFSELLNLLGAILIIILDQARTAAGAS